MNYLRTIFNKSTLLIFSTLLRLILIVVGVYYLSLFVGWFSYLLLVVRFVVFLKIVNDNTNPSHKIPWLVICLAFPVVGTTLYVLFSKKVVSYRQMAMFKKTRAVSQKYLVNNKCVVNDCAGIVNYISNTSNISLLSKAPSEI